MNGWSNARGSANGRPAASEAAYGGSSPSPRIIPDELDLRRSRAGCSFGRAGEKMARFKKGHAEKILRHKCARSPPVSVTARTPKFSTFLRGWQKVVRHNSGIMADNLGFVRIAGTGKIPRFLTSGKVVRQNSRSTTPIFRDNSPALQKTEIDPCTKVYYNEAGLDGP